MPTLFALLMATFWFACSAKPEPGATDADYDGFDSDEDCDDDDGFVYPGAPEICDGKDNDCDDAIDEDVADFPKWLVDEDGDGFGGDEKVSTGSCEPPGNAIDVGGDCDDANAAAFPGAPETCKDTADLNCDGALPTDDNDKDGFMACEECDDFDASQNPDADEVCNGEDDDCDGEVDEDPVDAPTWYPDADGDGHGVDGTPIDGECVAPEGYGDGKDDCDDANAATFPGAEEVCDGEDNDCDKVVPTDELDEDGDGFDICGDQDCDDHDSSVGPDGDNDTDGTVDCYDLDDDNDGLNDLDETVGLSGWVTDPNDADTDGDGVLDGVDAAPLHNACSSVVYYYDDFTTSPSDDWEEPGGIWDWDTADLYASGAQATFGVAWLPDQVYSDVVVAVTMRLDNDINDAGVMFRVVDPGYGEYTGGYYYLELNPGTDTLSLVYWASGNSTYMAETDVDLDAGDWHDVAVSAVGSTLQAAIDGVWVLKVDDTTLNKGGVGLRTTYSEATYDDVLICL